jgi:short-subunit dehydrogenase
MPRRELKAAHVLVTGASSGIGRALCIELAERGARVLATARRDERLVSLAAEIQGTYPLEFLAGDISDPLHRNKLREWVDDRWGHLDVLVNNAGVGAIGPFTTANEDRLRRVMEVDFFAPVELTRLMLAPLRLSERKRGSRPAILNIGSVLSHRAVPNKSEYCAAKFAMRGWSESLRVELRRDKIDVLMLSPSTTRSEFFESLVDTDPTTQSKSIGSMSPEQVAHAAIISLVRSKREMILSWGGKAMVWTSRFFPRMTDAMLGRFGQ